MNQELLRMILERLNLSKLNDDIVKKLSRDKNVYQEMKTKLLDSFMSYSHQPSEIERKAVEIMAERIADEIGPRIQAKLDMNAILNSVTIGVAKRISKGVGQ